MTASPGTRTGGATVLTTERSADGTAASAPAPASSASAPASSVRAAMSGFDPARRSRATSGPGRCVPAGEGVAASPPGPAAAGEGAFGSPTAATRPAASACWAGATTTMAVVRAASTARSPRRRTVTRPGIGTRTESTVPTSLRPAPDPSRGPRPSSRPRCRPAHARGVPGRSQWPRCPGFVPLPRAATRVATKCPEGAMSELPGRVPGAGRAPEGDLVVREGRVVSSPVPVRSSDAQRLG